MTATDELEEFKLSELEQKAQERRERLKSLRANKTLAAKDGENGESEGLLGAIGRRSYQPVNASAALVDEDVKGIIEGTEESVKQIIEDSKNLVLGDNLDVSIIAPRKIDWDLRRGIEDKLEKLDRRTNRAINSIVRQKMMKDGSKDLATSVGAMTEQIASSD